MEDICTQPQAEQSSSRLDRENLDETYPTSASYYERRRASELNQSELRHPLTKRNAPCHCGSGRRFKHCHGQYETNSRSTRPQVRDDRRPSRAIEAIVASYFKMKDRRALFDLRAHRQQVLDELQAISGIDPADAVRTVRDEIEIIEGCIMELDAPTDA